MKLSAISNRASAPVVLACFEHGPAHLEVLQVGPERVFHVKPSKTPPRATVVFCHGLTNHATRHLELAWPLAEAGLQTVFFDLAGHGTREVDWSIARPLVDAYLQESTATTTRQRLEAIDSSTIATVNKRVLQHLDVREHLDQLHRVLGFAAHQGWIGPDDPFVLAGHSMGGLLIHEASRRGSTWTSWLAGLLMLSPALRLGARPGRPAEQALVDRLWSRRHKGSSRRLLDLARLINLPLDTVWGNAWLSDLQDEVRLYAADPATPVGLPSRYVLSIARQLLETMTNPSPPPTQCLVVVPDRDGITPPEGGRRLADEHPDRVELVCLDGLVAHDPIRSSARDRCLEAVVPWVSGRCTG